MQIGTNHFGHFFLTILLIDKLKNSTPSRVINISSLAHESIFDYNIFTQFYFLLFLEGNINFEDLNSINNYEPWKAYRQSKLCNVLFTLELSKRLLNSGVSAIALHPGVVRTELGRYFMNSSKFINRILYSIMLPFMWLLMKTPEQGAQTTIYCAVAEELENVSGKYYSDCKEKLLLPHVKNDQAERLWIESEKLIKTKIIF